MQLDNHIVQNTTTATYISKKKKRKKIHDKWNFITLKSKSEHDAELKIKMQSTTQKQCPEPELQLEYKFKMNAYDGRNTLSSTTKTEEELDSMKKTEEKEEI